MGILHGKKPKYLREIEKHRELYKKKNLKFVRDNWIFYWRFLAYLEDIAYCPRTIERFYEKIRHFLKWLQRKSIRKVKNKDIDTYLIYLRDIKNIKLYTLRYYRESIGVFFSFVMRFSGIKINPVSNLSVRISYKQPEKMEVFTKDEINMLVKKPLQFQKREKCNNFKTDYAYRKQKYILKLHHLIMKIMFSTGIRPWEVVNLKISDVLFNELKLNIQTKGNQQYIMKDRYVFISEKTRDELQQLIEEQKQIRTKESGEWLFIHYMGWKLGKSYPNIIIKLWANRCGIKRNVYAYMMRYTYCTRLVENGIDPYSLRRLMGHKQIEVTLKYYLKLTKAELRREWEIFNPLKRKEA